jgi:hypothetical protein
MNLKIGELQRFSVFRNNSRIFAGLPMCGEEGDNSFIEKELH